MIEIIALVEKHPHAFDLDASAAFEYLSEECGEENATILVTEARQELAKPAPTPAGKRGEFEARMRLSLKMRPGGNH